MSDERALLAAIRNNPEEDTPRLMYADWLDENATSDAQRARAEFIRVQIERFKLYDTREPNRDRDEQLQKREVGLETRHLKDWIAEFPQATVERSAFSRGFLSRIKMDAAKCIGTARPSWYREPLVEVVLTGDMAAVRRLCEEGWFDGLPALTLRPSTPADADGVAQALADSSCAASLRKLTLWDDGCGDGTLQFLSKGSFGELRALSCMGQFTPRGWEMMLNSPAASRLQDLTIGYRGPGRASRIRSNSALAEVLVEAPVHSQLKFLWLTECALNTGLTRMATQGRFARLRSLHIDNEDVGTSAIAALGRGDWPALADLRLYHCELKDTAVRTLVKSNLMARLESLDISSNRVTAAGVREIAASADTGKMKCLDLSFNAIGDEGVIALARSPNFPALEEMHLTSTQCTDAGADEILLAPWASQVATLFLSYNNISQSKRNELRAKFGSVVWVDSDIDEDR